MESQEETLVFSSPNRSESPRSSTADAKEKPTYLKLLVSNLAAGSIIGRGGVNITELQSLSGARIQLSRNNEFFPGTSDRIIVISGVIDEIMKAVELILEKLEDVAEEISDADPRSLVRLVVPNGSCGGIIGKGGSTIKSFIEESGAGIKVLHQDNNYFGLNDRLVVITGSLEECIYAIDLTMLKLVEDARYSLSAISPYPYASVAFGYSNPSAAYTHTPNGVGGNYPSKKGLMPPVFTRTPAASEDGGISVTIAVADEHVGAVVGRGGRNIIEIMQVSGARIKISDRDDFMPGTTDRKVTITGSRDAIRAAEDMVMDKVSSLAADKLTSLSLNLALND